jgi:hypothetical protein
LSFHISFLFDFENVMAASFDTAMCNFIYQPPQLNISLILDVSVGMMVVLKSVSPLQKAFHQ